MPIAELVRKTTFRPSKAGAGVGVSMAVKPFDVKSANAVSRLSVS